MSLVEGIMHSSGGLVSFMRTPYCDLEDIPDPTTAAAIIGIPEGSFTCLQPDTRLGPRAIREYSLMVHYPAVACTGVTLRDASTGRRIRYRSNPRLFDLGDIPIDFVDAEKTNQNIVEGLSRVAQAGLRIVSLGGSHYINYPCFWGVSEGLAKGQKDFKMGYIHMDAHLDFFEFPSIGKYHHANGCCHISKLDCVDISNMVWIGIRGAILTYESCEYIESNGGYIYTMDQVREEGVVKVAEKALAQASKGADAVYLSIDTDVLDPPYVPGTSVPVAGGLTGQELLDVINLFGQSPIVRAMDVVEFGPGKDTDPREGITAGICVDIITTFLYNYIFEYC